MKNLHTWFEKGMTQYEYIQHMNVHQENLLKVYNELRLTPDDLVSLRPLQTKGLKAVILTADWCGDAMVNLPIFMRLAHEALIEARYLIRDENLELMDQYLTNGTARSIPIILLLDKDGNEIGKWGPRAPKVQELVGQMKANLPAKDSAEFEAAFKNFAQEVSKLFTTNKTLWLDIKQDLIERLRTL
ncbi:MAG TPA: thioredoxin family protein [Bacillus sp. (in: firmicutes)]|nr:thioredoxin family protein [Bacillus sp. (in: firmicutes)]